MPERAPGETYAKLLVVLDQLAREAVRLGDEAICGWTELAQLGAIDLGDRVVAGHSGRWTGTALAQITVLTMAVDKQNRQAAYRR